MEELKYPYPGATHAAAYEWLNRCTDPERKVEAVIAGIRPWRGRTVLDIGAGSGFHSVWFAQQAAHVIAIEPDPRLRRQMFSRLADAPSGKVSVLAASAEKMPLPDECTDLAYARFAYFFGTSDCLPGLTEIMRVLKPGGDFFIIDVIPEGGEWGRLAAKAYPSVFRPNYHANQHAFYREHGFRCHRVETVFRAPNRSVLRSVFKMDFPHVWEELLRQVSTLALTYHIAVFHRHKRTRRPNRVSQRIAHPRCVRRR
jgi:ubiquinone/menaquinone biosynthesis C-methylase UbiE